MNCLACGSAVTLRGHVGSAFGEAAFEPVGLRLFIFGARHVALGDARWHACLDCGHLWGECDPARLRALIDRAAGDALLKELRRLAQPGALNPAADCPACLDTVTVPADPETGNRDRFLPEGLRWFTFNRWVELHGQRGIDLLTACTSCGHVWGAVVPGALQRLIDASANDELRARLRRLGAQGLRP